MRSPQPPYLISQLAGHPQGRIKLVCGACTWRKDYSAARIAERIAQKNLGRLCVCIADVARFVPWNCPACGRARWYTAPVEFRRDRGQRIENPTIPPRGR